MTNTPMTPPETDGKTDLATLLAEPAPRVWYRRPVLWGGIVLLALTVAGLWFWQASRAANAAPSYITQPVARGNLTLSVIANGTLQPTRSINIGSELSGTVLQVNVDVNHRVKRGQVLVMLDTAKLRDQISRSTAALAAAQAKVAQTVATVKEARVTLARFEEVARLSAGKVPSKTELDSARATLERATADESSARAGVKEAQATLSTDQINLSKASIVAPTNGIVLTRTVEPGNAVAAYLAQRQTEDDSLRAYISGYNGTSSTRVETTGRIYRDGPDNTRLSAPFSQVWLWNSNGLNWTLDSWTIQPFTPIN